MIDPLVQTVTNMMSRFGGPATLTRENGEATYDPVTSTLTKSNTIYTLRVIAFDYIQKGSGVGNYFGTMVQTGDKQLYIKPASDIPAPEVDDIITFEGAKWKVVAVKAHNPSGANAFLHEVYMRQ